MQVKMKPLIIGEAPSKNEVTEHPIEGRAGKRLAALAGLPLSEFLAHFNRVNLLHVRQDTAEHGFQFDRLAAYRSAQRLIPAFQEDEQIILMLGKRVADAFGITCIEYFVERRFRNVPGEFRVLPHPSGINRWWNDPHNVLLAKQFMQNIVARTR
jgi:uracil-DNA glycosylase